MSVLALLTLVGCKHLDPAPEDAAGAADWLYANFDGAEPAAIADAVAKMHDDLDAGAMTEAIETTMDPLSVEAVAAVGRTAVESLSEADQAEVTDAQLDSGELARLSDQQGMLIVTVIGCPRDEVEALLAATNQDEIHGGYDAYDRRWDGDGADYFARTADRLTWTTDYTVSVVGSTYHATIEGGLRYVPATSGDDTFRFGDVVLGRAVLPEPGVFDTGEGYFRQDYQLDVLWERAPGETVHAFGVWRDLLVAGFHSSNPGFISLVSDRSVEADQEIEDLCAAD
jgi:hypothetical protein